jgi:hypothetical protein
MSEPRYNVKFTPAQNEALERMAIELDTTKADVLRKALSLLQVAVRETKAGNHLCVANDGAIVKEIVGIY